MYLSTSCPTTYSQTSLAYTTFAGLHLYILSGYCLLHTASGTLHLHLYITRHLLFGFNRHRYQSLPIQYAKNQFSIIQRNYNSETLKLLFDFFYGSSEEVGEGLSLARNWKAVVGEHNQLGMDGTEQVLNVVSIHKHRQFFIKGMYPQYDQLIVHMQCDNLTILRFTQNPPI